MDEEVVEYNENISEFTRDRQAQYLLKLRKGTPERKSAREIGFEPKVIMQYRKENPLFEEECAEALAEAEEEVMIAVRDAAVRGEPWAGRGYQAKWGWSDKKEGDKTQVNVFSGLELTGNPIERLLKMQQSIVDRPELEIPEPVIDVTLDELE